MKKFQIKWEVVITIIISIVGVFISWQAYKISELQAEIARNSLLPNIQVNEIQKIDEQTGDFYETVLQISNLEGKIYNFDSEIVTFLSCEYVDKNGDIYIEDIPLFSYYIVRYNSGNNIGVLEEKITAGNWNRVKQLRSKILEYNKTSGESLYMEIDTYVAVKYIDLLNDEQILYYSIDLFDTTIMDKDDGKVKFDRYYELVKKDLYINPNNEEIEIEEVIENIFKISELSYEEHDENNETKEGEFEGMTEVLSAILGAVVTYWFGIRQERKKEKKEESHATSILYYDLKSIEYYLTKERSSVNLRYSNDWQSIVASCSFLTNQQVKCIYDIYDKVYNYNYFYKLKERKKESFSKGEIPQYNELRKIMFDDSEGYINDNEYNLDYKRLLDVLEEVCGTVNDRDI